MQQYVQCITDRRPDMGSNIPDPFIRENEYYIVVCEKTPSPVKNGPDWILIQNQFTREIFARPRYMFGSITTRNTTSSAKNS